MFVAAAEWLQWFWRTLWPFPIIVVEVFITMWIADFLLYRWEVRRREKLLKNDATDGEWVSLHSHPRFDPAHRRWKFSFWPRFLRRKDRG